MLLLQIAVVILAQAAGATAKPGPASSPQTTQPTAPSSPPTAPTQPEVRDVQDTRSTRETNETRDLAAGMDARTTREGRFDPVVARADREAEETLRAQRAARNAQATGVRLQPLDINGDRIQSGGTDYVTQASIIEGYNTNIVQTVRAANAPIVHNRSFFTGAEAMLTRRSWLTAEDPVEISLLVRGQHFTPLDEAPPSNDGAILGSISGSYSIHPRAVLVTRLLGSVQTLDSSRLSDGALFQLSAGSPQRSFAYFGGRLALNYEHTERVRSRFAVDAFGSSTIQDTPIDAGNGMRLVHKGLDYVEPGADATVFYDQDVRNTIFSTLRYAPLYTVFLVDFTQEPPNFRGRSTTHSGEMTVGLTHTFSPDLRTTTVGGIVAASAPPFDSDRRPILSPIVTQELLYIRPGWLFNSNIGYAYGTFAPRLGFGPGINMSATLEGTPFPHTRLKGLALLFNVVGSRTAFRQDPTSISRLTFLAGTAEIRYGINNWLGILAGYDIRLTKSEGLGANPDFFRQLVFFGFSGYLSTDRSLPTLQTFAPPLTSG